MWYFPVKHCNGVPVNNHPGAFAANSVFDRKWSWFNVIGLVYCFKYCVIGCGVN